MRIKELTLYTDQIESQRAFHEEVFGLTLLNETESSFSFQVGWSRITFTKSKTAHFYHYCYLIPKGSMDSAIEWFSESVQLISTDGEVVHDHKHWNAKAIYYYDGGGNIAEFIIREELNYKLEGEFSLDSIICMNEIGAPSSDSKSLNDWLSSECGSEVWRGDVGRFATHGSEEGMFLLVNNTKKDKWYPTDHYPEASNFEVKIELDAEEASLSFRNEKFFRNI